MQFTDLPHLPPGGLNFTLEAFSSSTKAKAIFFTSFYQLQPHTVETLRAKLPIPLYSVGPSIPYTLFNVPKLEPISIFRWLDSQPEASVLYISLGSFLTTSKEQMLELSAGFRASGIKYLWVAKSEGIDFSDEMGLVVPWCDQLRVLCHSSVGGFLTHCGWNSTMESIFAGVPMLTFPLSLEQPYNSKLIVEDWKVGIRLKEKARAEDLVGRQKVAESVRRLMDLNGEEGKRLRRKAKELQKSCQAAIEVGGSTDSNIDAFITDIIQGQL